MTASTQGTTATEGGAKHGTLALALICVAQLIVVIDSTIINIALPRIGASLDIAPTNLSWLITGYALAFGGFLLLGGRLADIFGRRRFFIIGLVVFALASAVGGAAQNEPMLLGSRLAQGLGAALLSPAALALIATIFPVGAARTRAFSVFAATGGVGAGVGLVLGGWLTSIDPEIGWRLTFLINVPIGIGAALMARAVLPESDRHRERLDVPGALIGTLGLLALVYGITRTGGLTDEGQTYGWGDPVAIAFMGMGVLLLTGFVLVERTSPSPMLPLSIFENRQRVVALVGMTIMPAALFAMFFFLSLYVQNVMGYDPLLSGLAFLPFTLGMIGGSTLASRLVLRIAPRIVAGGGALLSAASLLMLSRLPTVESASAVIDAAAGRSALGGAVDYWWEIAPFILTLSIGMGFAFVPLTLAALHRVRYQDVGAGAGLFNAVQQVGGALGLALLSAVSAPAMARAVREIGNAITEAGARPSGVRAADLATQLAHAGFSHAASIALLGGAALIAAVAVLVFSALSVRSTDLARDGNPET